MRIYLVGFLKICLIGFVFGQSNIGLLQDNYSGAAGLANNPANSADSRFKFHMHILGFSGLAMNNYFQTDMPYSGYGLMRPSTIPSQYQTPFGNPVFNNSFITERRNGKDIYSFADIRTSAFEMLFSSKDGQGFHGGFQVRTHVNVNSLEQDVLKTFMEDLGTLESNKANQTRLLDQTITGKNMRMSALAYSQFSLGYSRVIQEDDINFWKMGATVHRNTGLGGTYLNVREMRYTLIGYDSLIMHDADLEFAIINEGYYDNSDRRLNDYFGKSRLGGGFGLDLGVVYEHRPDFKSQKYKIGKKTYSDRSENIYKWKVAASILDFGYVNFKNNENIFQQRVTSFSDENIPFYNFNDASQWSSSGDVDSFINAFFPVSNRNNSFRMITPARLNLNVDYKYQDNWYLSAGYQQTLVMPMARGARLPNILSAGVRYETRWYTIAVPVSFSRFYNIVNTGLYARAGIFYIGTDNLGAFLTPKRINGFQIYSGFNWPIHFYKILDSDGDGIPDNEDECPNEPGTKKTKGCPDADNDGVPDHLDDCPNEPGKKSHSGCPDSDGDGIRDLDDQCPDILGKSKFQGCPDEESLEDALNATIDRLNKEDKNQQDPSVIKDIISDKFEQFDFEIFEYWPVVGAYNDLRWALELKNRLNAKFDLKAEIKTIKGESKYYVLLGEAKNSIEAKKLEEKWKNEAINKELNGQLWWKKVPKT